MYILSVYINGLSEIYGLVHPRKNNSPCMVVNVVHHRSPPFHQHLDKLHGRNLDERNRPKLNTYNYSIWKKKPLRKGGMMYFLLGKYGYPQIIHFNGVFHYKLSILGYPYFWKHLYLVVFQSPPNHQPHRKNDPPASCIPSFLVAQGTVVDKLRKFISPLG